MRTRRQQQQQQQQYYLLHPRCQCVCLRLHFVVLRRGSVQLALALESLPLLDAQLSLFLAQVRQGLIC